MGFYEPEADSDLLRRCVLNFVKSGEFEKILEVGVGSGYVIGSLAEEMPDLDFYGCDINEEAVSEVKANLGEKVSLKRGALSSFDKRFDLILFNPPYLPLEDGDNWEDLTDKDKAIYGGKKGNEVIIDFIREVGDYLNEEGIVIFLVSSIGGFEEVKQELNRFLFDFEILDSERFFFEELYCIKATKKKVLKDLGSARDIGFVARGKHSFVYECLYGAKPAIIKTGSKQFIKKEGFFLEKLQNYDFVPSLYYMDDVYIIMEKVEGELLNDFIRVAGRKEVLRVLNKIVGVTMELDKLGINKFEFVNPYKHIFVVRDERKGEIVKLIDFERSIFTKNPKNTTQFLQFLAKNNTSEILKERGVYISGKCVRELGGKYKKGRLDSLCVEDLLEK